MNFYKNYCSIIIVLFTICITSVSAQITNDSNRIVHTKQGALLGTYEENNVLVWRGIRYAKPPVGDLRFKSPQPPDSWEGIKDASKFGTICPQMQVNVINPGQTTSEDCLFLNVWSTNTKTKKPVMVWIHGGGFYTGSGSASIFNGSRLAQKGDVVIVTFNYRLGALGFLYFDEIAKDNKNFDNNIGIRDQVAALKWVKENIENFGGDPENITIFGQSAGGTSVLTLLSTPSAKGLFHKAISESPSTMQNWTPQEATQITKVFLSKLGVSENNLTDLYKIHADSLVKVVFNMVQDHASIIPRMGSIAPTIDNEFIIPFLSEETAHVPLLIGTTKNETNLFSKVKAMPFEPTPKIIDRVIPAITENDKTRIASTYPKYPKEQTIMNIMTDGIFRMPCIQKAEAHAKIAPTYMYRFDWSSVPLNLMGYKSCHSIDLFFVFNTFDTKVGKKVTKLANKRAMYRVSDNVQQAWLNFAKTGSPDIIGVDEWKQYDSTQRATMIFDKKTRLTFDPNSKERMSWDGVKLN